MNELCQILYVEKGLQATGGFLTTSDYDEPPDFRVEMCFMRDCDFS